MGWKGMESQKLPPPHSQDAVNQLFNLLKGYSVMIEECIVQHHDMIYGNTSVNTIRAHSVIDKDGEVHLSKMLFRVGVGDSVVDNYAHGGCVYEVQLETGRIISPSLKKDGTEVYIHPQTDIFHARS